NPAKILVGVAGFEPATPSSRTRCATRLRYTPTGGGIITTARTKPQAQGLSMTAEPGTRLLPASAAAIAAAARCLAAGGLVAFPTETVYGLGADARRGEAVARLYAAKGRPSFNPLIAHVADAAGARRLGVLNADAERLAAAFWPGPLTLVLPRRPDCPV